MSDQYSKIQPFRKRRTRRAKARPPARPTWLEGEAAGLWDELAREMARYGWLDDLSAFGFACYCALSAEFQQLDAEISRLGSAEAAAKGLQTAWLGIAAELREISNQYFLNPASRAQHGVEPAPGA